MPLHSKIAGATGAEGMCRKADCTLGCSSAEASPSRFSRYFQADRAEDIRPYGQRLAAVGGTSRGWQELCQSERDPARI
ncbi:probable exported protease [Rhodovulum sulfidophilum]|uniref:Probable exported protease n=1 Tax=Rhodovulum sulfidophilum TaxID=35806 RepID=A0A0D6B1L5_RHOSU|nr:probable exported protease [Rhodovulum sulfidophilum]